MLSKIRLSVFPLLLLVAALFTISILPLGHRLEVAGKASAMAPQGSICQWDLSTGSWNDPARWSCGLVPGPNDTAVVPFNSIITVSSPTVVGALRLDGGELVCPSTLTVNNAFTWTSGRIIGAGTGVVTSNGALTMNSSPNINFLHQATLVNTGTAVWTGGLIQLVESTLQNQQAATFDIRTDAVFAGEASSSIVNAGTITKSTGSATVQYFTIGIINSGSLNVNAGIAGITPFGLTNSGSVSIASGARIQLSGNSSFTASSSLSGEGGLTLESAGRIEFNGAFSLTGPVQNEGNLYFETAASISTLSMNNGTLGGGGNVTILNTLNCTGDPRMYGTGSLTIAPGASFSLSPTDILDLRKPILNQGVMSWNRGFIDMFDSGRIDNQSGGTLNLVANAQGAHGLIRGNASGNAINNAGRVVRQNALGAFPTSIRVPFNNSGILEIKDASLDLRTDFFGQTLGTVNQTAGTTVLNNGTINGGLAINGGRLIGVGTVTGNVTNGGLVAPGLTDDAAGTLTVAGNYIQTTSGRLEIELGGTNPGVNSDLLSTSSTISTTAAFNGVLDISLLAGFHPAAAATFQIVRYGARSGQFATINGLDLGGGRVMGPEYRTNEMVLVTGNGGPAVPWIEAIAMPPDVRGAPGAPFDFDYTLRVGNSGGEPTPVIVVIELPKGPVIDPETEERAPVNDEIEEDVSNAPLVPITDDDDRALFNTLPKKIRRDDGSEVIPFVMSLPPGSSYSLQGGFTAVCPSGVGGGDPMPKVKMIGNSLWPSSECMSNVAGFLLGFVPGVSCINILRDFFVQESVSFAIEGKPASLSSVFASLALNAASCAADVYPVSKAIKSAIQVVDLISKGNDVYGIVEACSDSLAPKPSDSELGAETGTNCLSAKDPNDKVGPQGAGAPRFFTGNEPLRYTVFFENVPDATAPAQVVLIRDQLNPSLVNFNTFALGPVTVGDLELTPPQNVRSFTGDIDLRPVKNLLVRVQADLDETTGLVTWIFSSIDPLTGQPIPPASVEGFLNPNATRPEGEGSVSFMVQPRTGLVTGTVIANKAEIIFDANEPIETPIWSNTIDNTKPASSVMPLASGQCSSFRVEWVGSDSQSGVARYSVFVSRNGGSFEPWLRHTSRTSAFFNGAPGSTYAFYSIARDAAGNVEEAPPQPDTQTSVTTAMTISPVNASFNEYGGSGTVSVIAPGGCNWIAASRDYFIHVLTNPGGAGSGAVGFSVDPNPSVEPRTGSLMIAGNLFVISQAAGPALANRPPVAVDDSASTNMNTAVSIAVLGNDSDPDGDTLTIVSTTQPTHGSVIVTGAGVQYTPINGFTGPDGFTYTTSDGRGGTNTAAVSVSVMAVDTDSPQTTVEVTTSSLWPPNHDLINVGLSATAVDVQDGQRPVQVSIFANEDDEEPTGDELHSPDARDIAPTRLRLRAERKDTGLGRIYLIVVKAVDLAGNVGISCKTVTVPHDRSKDSIAALNARAAEARAFSQANGGAPPPGYFVVGDGPVIGSRQ